MDGALSRGPALTAANAKTTRDHAATRGRDRATFPFSILPPRCGDERQVRATPRQVMISVGHRPSVLGGATKTDDPAQDDGRASRTGDEVVPETRTRC